MNLNDAFMNLTERDFYAVGAATNLDSYSDLSTFKTVNSLDYNLSTFSELGHLNDSFTGQFVFIGKDNRIVGSLNSYAEKILIEEKIKEAMATFYGIRSKEHVNYYFLENDTDIIKFSDLFYYDISNDIEFAITGSTDESVCSYIVSGEEIYLSRGSKQGHTDLEIVLSVREKDIQIKTVLSVINSDNYAIENFEYGSVSESALSWITDETGGWETDFTRSFSGKMSLKSGQIDHSMNSEISINIILNTKSAITFAYKTDTRYEYYLDEIDGDFLNFYINGINVTSSDKRELWGGLNDWRMVSYQLSAGEHHLQWQYKKNEWGVSEEDAVWIDFVVLPESILTAAAGDIQNSNYYFKISPNPFNPSTGISFILDEPEYVKLSIFDIKGREVMSLIDREMSSGHHSLPVSPSNLAGGTYFTVFRTNKITEVNKIVLVK